MAKIFFENFNIKKKHQKYPLPQNSACAQNISFENFPSLKFWKCNFFRILNIGHNFHKFLKFNF